MTPTADTPFDDGRPRRESSVEWMLEIFDVTPIDPTPGATASFTGTSDGGVRDIVDGSQVLAQSLVAAGKALPGKSIRSGRAVFSRGVDAARPIIFDVQVVSTGRTVATAIVTARQDERPLVTTLAMLDVPQPDLIRHPIRPLDIPGPGAAHLCDMPMIGREMRMVDVRDVNDPDEVGPAELDAWMRFEPIPERDDLRKALLAHLTGHLSISTTFRGHAGIGTRQAHLTVSTGVMTIDVVFHEPVDWDGWVVFRHESTFVGAGMSYVRGQVLTESGTLIASFGQEGLIRSFGESAALTQHGDRARL